MKKFYLFLVVVLMASMSLPAQKVGYLLTESEITSLPDEDGQKPEQNAANWFKATYVDQNVGKFVSLSDLASGLSSDIKVLWINVDRNINISTFDALFSQEVRTAITNYVKVGGNLYLSTHATRIIGPDYINRASYPSFAENNGFSNGSDEWTVLASNGTIASDKTHTIYKYLIDNGKEIADNANHFHMQYGGGGDKLRSDRNCLWDVHMNEADFNNFQNNNTCHILGSFGQHSIVSVVGIAEFYPKNDFKGTVITNGLAACSFAEANANKDCVKYLTKGILDYLSKRATATWTTAPKANPVIKDEEDVTVTPGTYSTVSVVTSDPTIANYDGGRIYYNFFGDVTFTATATGDGVNIPKNVVLYSEVRTVTGGESDAEYGYVLPYSLKALKEYTGADATLGYPDYLAAKWFYDHYIDPNRTAENNYGNGRFVAKDNIPADNSVMKVLWFNMDRAGYAENDFENEFINTDFKTNLTTYATNGGNIFLTKQTCRLSKDMGRAYWYPVRFANGGISSNSDNWYITANFRLSEQDVDQSKHAAFKYMGDPTTEAGGYGWKMLSTGADQRTDNNTVWEDWGVYGTSAGPTDMGRLTVFEEGMHNCRILAGFGHTRALDAAGMVELLPYGSFNGTIIALGLSAYQWTSTNTAIANVQNLTRGVLEYLASADIYTRNVPADHYGTICLPRASASLSDGMKVYRVLSDQTDGIMLEEVNAMEAGVPYFFYSTATQISVTMTGAAELTPQNGNGLIGNFGPASVEIPNDPDNYILGSDNTLYYIDQAGIRLDANRAYLDRSTINQSTPSGMPKRVMGIHKAPSVATALDNTGSQNILPVKKLINGRLVIQVGDQLYDVTGTQVK